MNITDTFTNNDSLHFHQISHLFAQSPTAASYVQAQLNGINFNADNQQNLTTNINNIAATATVNNNNANTNANNNSNINVNTNINTITSSNINTNNATITTNTTNNANTTVIASSAGAGAGDCGGGGGGADAGIAAGNNNSVPVVTYNGNQYCVITRNDSGGATEKSELLQIHGQFTTDKEGKTNIILMSPVSSMPVSVPMQMQMHVPVQVEVQQNPN